MMELAIINIGQLVTLAGAPEPRSGPAMRELSIIENGAIICRDGLIAAVGTYQDIAPQINEDEMEIIDAYGGVVTPGLVDAHTHPIFAGTRENDYEQRISGKTYQEIAAAGGGIRYTVRLTRAASEEELFVEACRHITMMIEHGTTTAEAKSGYGLSLEQEMKMLYIMRQINIEGEIDLIPTFLGAHEFPDEYINNREGYIKLLTEQMIPTIAANNLARYCDVFCESHVFSISDSRRILGAAQRAGMGLRVHAEQLTLSGGARLAASLGAITADHLEQVDAISIRAMRDTGVMPVLLPGSVFHLGLKKYPPAREMIQAGLPVIIATDFNPGSSPTPSLPMAMSIACTQMQMTPAECLTACTINAAHSLELGHQIGTIEVNKYADLTLFNCPDYRQIPYFFGANLVSTVIKRGNVVYRRG